MTLTACHFGVLATQCEFQPTMVKSGETIDAIVTGQTVLTEIGRVLRYEIDLILAMAGRAFRRIKGADVITVAVGARKRQPGVSGLMRGQSERQSIVRKVR